MYVEKNGNWQPAASKRDGKVELIVIQTTRPWQG